MTRIGHKPSAFWAALAYGIIIGWPLACVGSEASADSDLGSPPITVTRSTTYATVGFPFSAVISRSGAVLVSVTADGRAASATGVQVFDRGREGWVARCLNALPASVGSGAEAEVLSLFSGTRERDAAMGIGRPGAIFYRVEDLLACNGGGYVVGQGTAGPLGAGTFAVAVTPDGKFAFVANEYGIAVGARTEGNIGVVAIERDFEGNLTGSAVLIGQIPTGGNAVAGLAISPDGRRVYVTSEVAAPSTVASGAGNPVLARTGCLQQAGSVPTRNGLLTVIDAAAAEANPGTAAILATIDAGCSPVRMAETRDQKTLWVSARGDDRLLAFDTATLELNPDAALLGYAATGGTAPVGIRLFQHDRFLAVANSNRFDTGVANATILDVTCPVSAKIVQTIPTGLFPREINVAPNDATLLLTNYLSETFQVIETSTRIWGDQNDEVPSAAGRGTSRENDSAGKPRHIGCQRPDHDSLGISGPSTGESDSN
jgi:DNA-binding beta-propeller fold protein YncE